jgi:hypothetical protein
MRQWAPPARSRIGLALGMWRRSHDDMPPNLSPRPARDQSNSLRADADYWHQGFSARTPYEVVEDIPAARIKRVEKLRTDVLRHPLVQRLEGLTVQALLVASTTSSTGVVICSRPNGNARGLCHLPFHSATELLRHTIGRHLHIFAPGSPSASTAGYPLIRVAPDRRWCRGWSRAVPAYTPIQGV